MKRVLYIFLFTVFTVLASFLVHALLEMATLSLLTNNLDIYGESYLWQNWQTVHQVAGLALTVIALLVGIVGGWICWNILYVEQRFGPPRW